MSKLAEPVYVRRAGEEERHLTTDAQQLSSADLQPQPMQRHCVFGGL